MPARQLEEVLKEVRRIQIVARRQVNDLLAGEYLSVFKGRGMEFDAVREYVPGDEIRSIDWNVTARTGTPFVKTFCEERELTVILAVDISASGSFGSFRLSKMETAVEVAAVLMFTALKNHDKVGLLFFTDDVVKYIPPRKGRANVLRLIRELLATEPVKAQTDISNGAGIPGPSAAAAVRGVCDERFSGAGLFARPGDRQPAARLRRRDAWATRANEPSRRRVS